MSWWHYLLLVNFYLLLFFAFYVLLLRRETFFQLNRLYLVAASILSFAIPLIQADWVKNLFITKQVQYTLYGGPVFSVYNITAQKQSVTLGEIMTVVYITVTLCLTLRLLWQLIILKKQLEAPSPSAAYSFFKKISLGKDVADHQIIRKHEQVHATQWHSIDVMIIETVMIINWFNPVVYLYRFAIKYIHEYIADRQVVSLGTSKADYALLLLSQTFNVPSHSLSNPFYNHSLLKKRIMMLQKSRSQRIMLFKYCLSAPLFILMLILSSATVNDSTMVASINNSVKQAMQAPVDDLQDVIEDHAEIPVIVDEVKFPRPVPIEDQIRELQWSVRADADTVPGDKKIFVAVENPPTPQGGMNGFYEYLASSIRYPAQARTDGVQGKVYLTFIVEADGSLTNIQAVRGPSESLKNEAIRVVESSPKWKPGYQNGIAVRTQFTVPINFSLENPNKPMGALPDSTGKMLNEIHVVGYGSQQSTINLRSSANQPLVIVDGVTRDNINAIDPNTIVTVTVLKDGSSTSLYGERGKNGVIVITTKKKIDIAPNTPVAVPAKQ